MGLRYKKIIASIIISTVLISLPITAQEEDENLPVRNLDEFVEKTVNKISRVIPFISGYVIYKKDNDIYIDLGKKQSVIKDMEFEVYREGKDIKHPVRDEYAGKVEEKIGELKIKILRDTLSIAEVVNLMPDRQIEAGDKVYSKKRWDKIAILPIANPKKEQSYFTKILYDLIKDKIVHTTSLTIITKNDVEKALFDLSLENSNNFLSDKAVISIGKKLKADIIIFGNLLDIGENFFLTLRFANSLDGSTFFVINTELKKERSLRALIYTMSQKEETAPVEKKIKTIKAPLFSFPLLNPSQANADCDMEVISNILDRMVAIDSTGIIIPGLAESWNVSKDGKLWIFNLRKNILFHNGDPFTAKDIMDSWQYEILNGQSYGAKFILGAITGVENYKNKEDKLEGLEILDDYTLQISLNNADYDFLFKLTHINTSVFSAKSFSNENSKNLIGTGPFKLIEQTNEKITLEINNNYFQGIPSVDRIEYTIIPNPAYEYQKFLAEEIDYYHKGINKDGRNNENIINADFSDIYYIAINSQYAPFNNEKIRQALNYAINRENFTKFFDSVSISNTILPSNRQQSDSSKIIFPYTFDPQKARKILDENGYSSTYLGQEFTLVYPDSDPSFKIIAEKVQENLIDIGINLRLQNKNANELSVIFESSAQPAFLLTSFQYIPFSGGELYFLKSAFSTQNKGNYGNYGFFSNSIVDALLSSYNEITEKEKKTGAYIELENTILREAPWIFLMSRNKKIIRQNYIAGITIGQYGINLKKAFLVNNGEPVHSEE